MKSNPAVGSEPRGGLLQMLRNRPANATRRCWMLLVLGLLLTPTSAAGQTRVEERDSTAEQAASFAPAIFLPWPPTPAAARGRGGVDIRSFGVGDPEWAQTHRLDLPAHIRILPGVDTIHTFDLRIALKLREEAVQGSSALQRAASAFEYIGLPGTVVAAGAMYGYGRVADERGVADFGLHMGQAIVVSGLATLTGKLLIGRARPYESPMDPGDTEPGRGFEGDRYQSFPSAHTTAAFAAATFAAMELSERNPDARFWGFPLLFGSAAMTGISRIFHEQHWATDVLGGALIGTLGGWGTAEYHR